MHNKKIIMFEGICGSGKTTTAKQLHEYLQKIGINSHIYIEGEKNPLELLWYACFTKNEFKHLCGEYPFQAAQINQRTFHESNYIFVEYRTLKEYYFDGELLEKLKEKEFCYGTKPVVSSDIYTEILKSRWKKFARYYADNNDTVIIFDGTIFQHQIHDMQRLYNMSNDGITNHISILSEQIAMFNPIIIYLTQSDIIENLKRIAEERNRPEFGTDERINYYKNRKQLEYQVMSNLKLKSYVINNSDYDYDKVFKIIKTIADIN